MKINRVIGILFFISIQNCYSQTNTEYNNYNYKKPLKDTDFTGVEELNRFIGGFSAYEDYISTNMNFPLIGQ